MDISSQTRNILSCIVSTLTLPLDLFPLMLMIEKPDPSDEVQLRRDKRWGVLYADDLPHCNTKVEPNMSIVYTNEKTWREDRSREIRYCNRLDDLLRQKALEDAVEEFEESELGQALKEMNIEFDDPMLPDILDSLQNPLLLAMINERRIRGFDVEASPTENQPEGKSPRKKCIIS